MPQVSPLNVPIPLAKNPKNPPQYKIECQLKNGESVALSDPKAVRAMVALMDMAAVLGGAASHWGGPSAFAELMAAIYGFAFHQSDKKNAPHYDLFHIVNDAGHCENGIYALKANYGYAGLSLESLKGFRSIHSGLTGHGEVHLFREGVFISNGPLGSGLPQAQGLAMADALSGKCRITVTAVSDGASFEGEAKEAFAAIPGLARKGKMAPFICVISDNNTKLSGRIDEQSFSMNETFASLEALGWKLLRLPNGNDLKACLRVFEEAVEAVRADPKQPVAIHAKTVKGFGVKKTVESSSGGHGFPLSDPNELDAFLAEIYQGGEVPAAFTAWAKELQAKFTKKAKGPETDNPNEKVQLGVAKALIEKRKQGLPVVSLSSDLPGSTGMGGFQKEFPEASIDLGVAEANMVSCGTGLSKAGYIPVVDTFSQFGVTKGALPFIMASLSEGPMIAIFSHVGFQDAADGASHQALSYFSMVSSIPHVEVYNLVSSEEAYHLVSQAVDRFAEARRNGEIPKTYIFFLGREDFPRRLLDANYRYRLGSAQVLLDNAANFKTSVTIAAGGALVPQALKAAKELEGQGIGAVVVNPSIINHPDTRVLAECLRKTGGRLVTAEDHQLIGGMGAMLCHALLQEGVEFKVKSLGVQGEFGQSAYKAVELYEKHGLDAKGIVRAVKETF